MTGAPAPAVLVMGGFIVLLLLWLVHHLSRRRRFPLVFEAKVEHVCDGDSIIVRGRIGRVKLRIAGMDAPETAQPRGRESERRLRAMLQGRVVKVRSVAADRYGRWVSTVTADGVSRSAASRRWATRLSTRTVRPTCGRGGLDCEKYVLESDHYQVEVMANLDKLPSTGGVIFVGLPKFDKFPGFPVRAWAVVPNED